MGDETLSLAALSCAGAALDRWLQSRFPGSEFFYHWILLPACAGLTIATLRDHPRRCPVCLTRLRSPASFGSWSSMLVDRPATEYACPRGHGLLYVLETGERREQWTKLDESWRGLFEK